MFQTRAERNRISRFTGRVLVRENWFTSEKVIPDDGIERPDSIAPGNLLSFFIGTAIVGDTDLLDAAASTRDFGGDLGFKAESVFTQIDVPQDHCAECLVAGFHIGEIDVCAHVGEQSQQFVSDHVPEINDPMRTTAHESGTENDVGLSIQDGLEQARIFLRVILEVGILDENDVARGGSEATTQSCAFASINAMINDAIGDGLDIAFQNRAAAVG